MANSRNRYDWELAEEEIKDRFGDRLEKGEHIVIWEDESSEIFGKTIARANTGKIDLDMQEIPPLIDTCIICYHLAIMGYSSRIGTRGGKKYVEIWLPKTHII